MRATTRTSARRCQRRGTFGQFLALTALCVLIGCGVNLPQRDLSTDAGAEVTGPGVASDASERERFVEVSAALGCLAFREETEDVGGARLEILREHGFDEAAYLAQGDQQLKDEAVRSLIAARLMACGGLRRGGSPTQ